MGLAQRPISPKGKDVVVRPGKSKEFSKNPWKRKRKGRMKWAENVQGIKWAEEARDVI